MARLLANRDGGTSNEYGTFAALGRLLIGDVIEGFQVVPNGTPNMTVLVNPGSGRISTGTYPSSYSYFVSHDTVGGELVTIATAAASPRIDYIVGYINKSTTPSASSTYVNNTNGIFTFASVAGTPAGSPLVPTVAQIQAAIGAANPYIILAQVAVGASVTTITSPNLTDIRTMASPTALPAATTGAWSNYTPVWTSTGTAPAIGNGTLNGAYKSIGKTTYFRIFWQAGSTTTFGSGSWRFSLPFTASNGIGLSPITPIVSSATAIGTWYGENPGIVGYGGIAMLINATSVIPHFHNSGTSGNVLQMGTTGPATWANTWYFMLSGTYEAA